MIALAHDHIMRDVDKRFIIDTINKTVIAPEHNVPVLSQYDHNSEYITFEADRHVEGHDLLKCDKVEVHYNNTNGRAVSKGLYEAVDLQVDPNDATKVIFTWAVSEMATQYAGKLNFIVSFVCTDDGDLLYRWNTRINSDIRVSDGINNAEYIENTYADVLAMWKQDLFGIGDTEEARMLALSEYLLADINAKAKDAIDSIPDEYMDYSEFEASKADKELIRTSNNLYNHKTSIDDYGLSTADGSIVANTAYFISDFIPIVTPCCITVNKSVYKVVLYGPGGVFIETRDVDVLPIHVTDPTITSVRLQFRKTDVPMTTSDIMVNYGSTSLEYEPYDRYADMREVYQAVESLSAPISTVEFEVGSIAADTGLNIDNRLVFVRSKNALDIGEILSIPTYREARMRYFCYDVDFEYQGYSEFMFGSHGDVIVDEITRAYPNTKYVRVIYGPIVEETISLEWIDSVGIKVYRYASYIIDTSDTLNKLSARMDKIDPSNSGTHKHYYGAKLDLRNASAILTLPSDCNLGAGQDGAFYGAYAIRMTSAGTFYLYTFENDTSIYIATGTIDPINGLYPHCNVAFFGSEFVHNDDPFPILYVNAYNTEGMPWATLYGYRIVITDGVYTARHVQTIDVGFTNNPELWSTSDDLRPYGNFAYDSQSRKLYVYTNIDGVPTTRFFVFSMPSYVDGDVTLGEADILNKFDVDHMGIIQGNFAKAEKIYICAGYGNSPHPAKGYVVDAISGKIVTYLPFDEWGVEGEPEMLDYKDNYIYFQTTSKLYRIAT